MPDFNYGDFTQQGIAGDVTSLVRLNEKRTVKLTLSADDASDNCDISGSVIDELNAKTYPIGAGVSGNIEITENGENINVAPYATATVNVSGGGSSSSEVVYVSGTFTPVYESEAQMYVVTIENPTVIAQALNNHFILTVGNETKNVTAATDSAQIPGALYRLEPETPEERGVMLGVMPTAIGSPTVIIAPSTDPVFIELKQVVGTLDITITSNDTSAPLYKVNSNDLGDGWTRTTAVYQADFEKHITIPYCGVKRAYIEVSPTFTYQNAVNCRVEDNGNNQIIVIYDNNASIDLSFTV